MRALILAALLVAALAILSVVLFAMATMERSCDGVDAEKLTSGQVGQLVSRGWFGDPHDGREPLYPPPCYPTEPEPYDGTLTPGSGV